MVEVTYFLMIVGMIPEAIDAYKNGVRIIYDNLKCNTFYIFQV